MKFTHLQITLFVLQQLDLRLLTGYSYVNLVGQLGIAIPFLLYGTNPNKVWFQMNNTIPSLFYANKAPNVNVSYKIIHDVFLFKNDFSCFGKLRFQITNLVYLHQVGS